MQVKVCGVQTPDELAVLDACGVHAAGLWWRLAEGSRNLGDTQVAALARVPGRLTRPVVVTIGRVLDDLVRLLRANAIDAVQLSGFELPHFVQRLRDEMPALRIAKTLHVQGETCLQGRHIEAYARAGVDVFIADRFVSKQAVGSTGQQVPQPAVRELQQRVAPVPLMLAGGMGPGTVRALAQPVWGIDVDSAVRGADGFICPRRVAELMDAVNAVGDRSLSCA